MHLLQVIQLPGYQFQVTKVKSPTELLNDKDKTFTNYIDRFLLVEVKEIVYP